MVKSFPKGGLVQKNTEIERKLLVFAKLRQMGIKLRWLEFLKENGDQKNCYIWKTAADRVKEDIVIIREAIEAYHSGQNPIETTTLFPPFPFNEGLMLKMDQFTDSMPESREHNRVHTRQPFFAPLILALETREMFIAFYKSEWERSSSSASHKELADRFIEHMADKFYPK
jgi:hypothetical protein